MIFDSKHNAYGGRKAGPCRTVSGSHMNCILYWWSKIGAPRTFPVYRLPIRHRLQHERPAYANKLFGAFNRLHGDEDFKGSGIGLATVARIVHGHHGRVWANSAVHQGANVLVHARVTTDFYRLLTLCVRRFPPLASVRRLTPRRLSIYEIK